MAVQQGLAEPAVIVSSSNEQITLDEGIKLYNEYLGRSQLLKGARESTAIRYRPVFKKFSFFAKRRGIHFWNQVTAPVLESYLGHLEKEEFAPNTLSLEITTLKQVNKFLIESKKLPAESKIVLPFARSQGSETYCWREVEVDAMLEICLANSAYRWLYLLLFTLVYTGLRISELAGLRWSNIDFETGMLTLRDETLSARKKGTRLRQTTKGSRNRTLPIHDDLRPVLAGIVRNPDGYVFRGPRGGRVLPGTVREVLVRVVLIPLAEKFPTSVDEIGFADGRLHSFRHYFCSQCASQNASQNVIMKWLGHRDSKMVEHYFHLHNDEARRQMQRLRLSGNTSGRVPEVGSVPLSGAEGGGENPG